MTTTQPGPPPDSDTPLQAPQRGASADPGTRSSAATRRAILDATERLLAQHGYGTVSIRQISQGAGVNLAAINYHFGTKEALIRAVVTRRLDKLNQERLRLLDELEQLPEPPRASQIVDAFFGTMLRQAVADDHHGRMLRPLLIHRARAPDDFIHAVLAETFPQVLARFRAAFTRAMPDVPEEDLLWRFQFMLGAASYALIGLDPLLQHTPGQAAGSPEASERRAERLMQFLLGGLRAPLNQADPSASGTVYSSPAVPDSPPISSRPARSTP